MFLNTDLVQNLHNQEVIEENLADGTVWYGRGTFTQPRSKSEYHPHLPEVPNTQLITSAFPRTAKHRFSDNQG